MDTPRQLPSGRWFIRWRDETGNRVGRTFATEAQAKAAARRGEVARDDVKAGLARPRGNLTLNDVWQAWLEGRPVKRQRDDESRLRVHVLPFFGAKRLADIDERALDAFARHMEAKRVCRRKEPKPGEGKPVRPMTIKNCLILICKLLGDHGFHVRAKYKAPTEGYSWIQDPADVARFLDACDPPWFRVACALAVHAGLRLGEVAGLKRDALDFERNLIRVDRSYDGPTKGKRVRYVPLSPELGAILKPWLLGHPGELVVTRPALDDGGNEVQEMIPEREGLAKATRRACKRAGVPVVTFHQLRHTHASHLAQRVSLAVVGAVLGHSDPRTTARYSHLDTESLARDARLHLSFAAPTAKVIRLPRRSRSR